MEQTIKEECNDILPVYNVTYGLSKEFNRYSNNYCQCQTPFLYEFKYNTAQENKKNNIYNQENLINFQNLDEQKNNLSTLTQNQYKVNENLNRFAVLVTNNLKDANFLITQLQHKILQPNYCNKDKLTDEQYNNCQKKIVKIQYMDNSYIIDETEENLQNKQSQQDPNNLLEIPAGKTAVLYFQINCPDENDIDETNYFTFSDITLKGSAKDKQEKLNFQQYIVCKETFRPNPFNYSYFILAFSAIIIILCLAPFGKINSYRTGFYGFKIRKSYVFIYIFVIFSAMGLSIIDQVETYQIDIQIVFPIMLFCCFFFSNELISSVKILEKLKRKICFQLRYMDIISSIFSISLISSWWLTNKLFWLSDIITICTVGSLMKLFKFNNLKTAFIFLAVVAITDAGAAVTLFYSGQRSYNSILISDFNTPFLFQIPQIQNIINGVHMGPQLFQRCVWISVSSLLFPGLLLGYTFRFDKSFHNLNQFKIYSIISLLSLFIGSGIWLMVCLFSEHSIPFSCISYPVMLLGTYLISFCRRENQNFWDGDFIDQDREQEIYAQILQDQAHEEQDIDNGSSHSGWKQTGLEGLSQDFPSSRRVSYQDFDFRNTNSMRQKSLTIQRPLSLVSKLQHTNSSNQTKTKAEQRFSQTTDPTHKRFNSTGKYKTEQNTIEGVEINDSFRLKNNEEEKEIENSKSPITYKSQNSNNVDSIPEKQQSDEDEDQEEEQKQQNQYHQQKNNQQKYTLSQLREMQEQKQNNLGIIYEQTELLSSQISQNNYITLNKNQNMVNIQNSRSEFRSQENANQLLKDSFDNDIQQEQPMQLEKHISSKI